MFFSQHKKGSIVLMTLLLITAYLGRFSGLDWLDDLSMVAIAVIGGLPLIVRAAGACLLYTSPSPRDMRRSRMPSSA